MFFLKYNGNLKKGQWIYLSLLFNKIFDNVIGRHSFTIQSDQQFSLWKRNFLQSTVPFSGFHVASTKVRTHECHIVNVTDAIKCSITLWHQQHNRLVHTYVTLLCSIVDFKDETLRRTAPGSIQYYFNFREIRDVF